MFLGYLNGNEKTINHLRIGSRPDAYEDGSLVNNHRGTRHYGLFSDYRTSKYC